MTDLVTQPEPAADILGFIRAVNHGRWAMCSDSCTGDCGHCKGAGLPKCPHGTVACLDHATPRWHCSQCRKAVPHA